MKSNPFFAGIFVLLAALLSACAAPIRPPAEDVTQAVEQPLEAAAGIGRAFTVDSQASELRIVVFADGPLARLGHPHVIGGPTISGTIWLADDFHHSSLELFIAVPALQVDEPDWRQAEGFDPDMDESAIDGTRLNLLSEDVLDADAHPQIVIRSTEISGPPWQPDVIIEITLRGQTRVMTVPVALELDGDTITATGRLRLRQSEFGIEPFSAAGGNLLVADEVAVRFRIKGRN